MHSLQALALRQENQNGGRSKTIVAGLPPMIRLSTWQGLQKYAPCPTTTSVAEAAQTATLSGVFLTPTLSRTATPPHFSSKRSYSGSLVLIETLDDEMETAVRAIRSDHSPFSKCTDAGRCTRYACVASHACDAAPRNGTVWLNAYNGLLGEARTGGRRWRGLGPLHDDDAQSDFVEIHARLSELRCGIGDGGSALQWRHRLLSRPSSSRKSAARDRPGRRALAYGIVKSSPFRPRSASPTRVGRRFPRSRACAP